MLRRNKIMSIIVSAVTALSLFMPVSQAYAYDSSIDYKTALKDAVGFYDSNKCGKEAGVNNVFDWRGPCHCDDGKSLGIDLSGGYHDAGDFVKFGLPQSYAASVMGWALYEFKDGFLKAGMYDKQLEEAKYFTDYLLKCHYEPGKFVYQVGNGYKDHDYWAAPEKQSSEQGGRDTILVADSSQPASDIIGESVAALSIMYLNYKNIDSSYADKCLSAAKELYEMGKSNQGKGNVTDFYRSTDYSDDMAWGAAWLYDATKESSYLDDAESFIVKDSPWLNNGWTMCWDNMKIPAELKIYQLTKDSKYKDAMDFNFNHWMNEMPGVAGGIKVYDGWGSLRYTAAESMLALIYNKQNPNNSLVKTAESQLEYILGKNPSNMSYMVGFGDNYPKHAHHRAANGYDKNATPGYKTMPNKHVLTGALVGGPDGNGTFRDILDEYTYTEVAIDYNAGFVGALAGYVEQVVPGSVPTQDENPGGTTKPDKPINDKVILGDVNGDGRVNISDYTLLRRVINGDVEVININKKNSDINRDGNVDFLDLLALKNMI